MLVIRASHMGMCFGVKDALDVALVHSSPEEVTIFGELVHNRTVMDRMRARGYRFVPESARESVPETSQVMITAHGVSDRERERLTRAGKGLMDTTCPLVRRVHKAALRFKRLGFFVVVVGREGHVEVEGLVGDLDDYAVVWEPGEVRRWPFPRIAVISQTTTPPDRFGDVSRRVVDVNRGSLVEVADTVCRPTRERQEAVERLLERAEALVVVGGKNSNNTRQLGSKAEAAGKPWLHVETAADLVPKWFSGLRLVGLTAGTSTPDETIEEVYRALLRIGRTAGATA